MASTSSHNSSCNEVENFNEAVQLSATSQFNLLARYAQVIAGMGEVYWIGYSFMSADDLGDIPSDIETLLLDGANYGQGDQAEAESGVCLAIGQDGLLYRRDCTTQLPAFCYQLIEGESVI